MQEFYFESADAEGKRISGVLKAESEDDARAKLKARNFAVFVLMLKEEHIKKKNNKEYLVYEFEGTDNQKEAVRGEIRAADEGAAYKSLVVEYEFDVKYIVPKNLPESEKKILQEKGIDSEMKEWLEKELKYSDYYQKKLLEKNRKEKRSDSVSLSEKQKKELEVVQKRIGEVAQSMYELLKENEKYLDKNKKREIEERLNLLSRLRQSNALEHLKSLTDKVVSELSDDALFIKEGELVEGEEGQLELQAARSKFKKFSSEFNDQLKKELSQISITIDLEAIDPNAIKDKIVKTKIPRQIGMTLYYTFLFLFTIMVFFWLFNGVQVFLLEEQDPSLEKVYFYLNSSRLWSLTMFSIFISLGFFPLAFLKRNFSISEQILYFIGIFSLCFLFFFQFHLFFPWTS